MVDSVTLTLTASDGREIETILSGTELLDATQRCDILSSAVFALMLNEDAIAARLRQAWELVERR